MTCAKIRRNSNPLSTISDTTRPAPRYAATRSLQAPSRASCIVSRKSSGAGDQKVIFNAKIQWLTATNLTKRKCRPTTLLRLFGFTPRRRQLILMPVLRISLAGVLHAAPNATNWLQEHQDLSWHAISAFLEERKINGRDFGRGTGFQLVVDAGATAVQKDIVGIQHHPKTVAQFQLKCVDTPRTPQTPTSCAG